jgi:hypothetical protein
LVLAESAYRKPTVGGSRTFENHQKSKKFRPRSQFCKCLNREFIPPAAMKQCALSPEPW